MLVFIDESGDPGFRMDRGSSAIFVAAMVIFEDSEAAAATASVIAGSAARQAHRAEFKFSKCSDEVRDQFFQSVGGCAFTVRAIVVRKDKIRSPLLKSDKEKFYEFFVRQMMTWDGGVLDAARIVIDGSGDREFQRDLNSALRRRIGDGKIRDIRFKDSRGDDLVQLADMCAGAIARSYRQDRENPTRWRRMLRRRIRNVWEFE